MTLVTNNERRSDDLSSGSVQLDKINDKKKEDQHVSAPVYTADSVA